MVILDLLQTDSTVYTSCFSFSFLSSWVMLGCFSILYRFLFFFAFHTHNPPPPFSFFSFLFYGNSIWSKKRPFNLIRAEFLFIFYGSFVYGCKTLHCLRMCCSRTSLPWWNIHIQVVIAPSLTRLVEWVWMSDGGQGWYTSPVMDLVWKLNEFWKMFKSSLFTKWIEPKRPLNELISSGSTKCSLFEVSLIV